MGNCQHCKTEKSKWYKNKLLIVTLILIVALVISYIIPILNPFYEAFFDYLKIIWWAILLGLVIGGLIDYFIPSEYVSKYLASSRKRTIGYAVLLGFLMSACSHGILAIAIQLYKKGASISSVVAFFLAAPWANLTITIMLFGFFGWKALFIVISAILIAIITGLIYQVLERRKLVEEHRHAVIVDKKFSIKEDLKKRYKNYKWGIKDVKGVLEGMWSLSQMILWWIIIGMFLASLARAFVPEGFFHQYMGASILGLFVTLIIATIIEVCSEGSSPMAFEIFRQTGAFGNAFTFLMAGVVTDYTEIGLIWSNIGKKAAIWLPIITVPQVLILGYLFNLLL